MADLTELFWRPLPGVRTPERSRFLFFAGLATLISLAQTVGLAGSEALFLSRFGAARLPETFIAASILTVLGSVLYATRVGNARNDVLFIQMLAGAATALAGATWLVATDVTWVLPALFCFFYLTQAIFVNHLWTFTGDYFDSVASKRLIPLFTIGASIGGVLGGLLATAATRFSGAASLIAAWGVFLFAAAVMLRIGQRRLRLWGPLELEEADETSVEGMRGALRYLRDSALGSWLVLSALGMVLALFVAQFLYSDILARSFPDPARLAAFLGIYLAVTNVVEIAIEMWITPTLIARFGVATTHLVHPVLTLASFGGLFSSYGLTAGLLARVNRELIENALAGPVRNLVYNAVPQRFRGRMRAFLEGIVVYAGMALAGVMLLFVGHLEPWILCAAGSGTALLYLAANMRARRAYLQAIVTELRAGRLDLSDVGGQLGRWEAARLAETWEQLLAKEGARPSRSLFALIPTLVGRELTGPLIRACAHANPEVRRACITGLAGIASEDARAAILGAMADPDARVRLAAIRSLGRIADGEDELDRRRRSLVDDPDPDVRAEAALHAGSRGVEVLRDMIESGSPEAATAALRRAPAALAEAALAHVNDPAPGVRAAALECLAHVSSAPPLSLDALRESLADREPRVRRAAVMLLANQDDAAAIDAIAGALADPASDVRFGAETVLSSLRDAGAAAATPLLRGDRERGTEAALRVIANSETPDARSRLAGELAHHCRRMWHDLIAFQLLAADGSPSTQALLIAYQDGLLRSRRLAFRILDLLENPAIIQKVDKALRFGTARSRGDALEVLSNLGDRESAQLLVLMHESGPIEDRIRAARRIVKAASSVEELIEASKQSSDRWIRIAAHWQEESSTMEPLLALKQVALFANLSLEQLEAVYQVTRELTYVRGEEIMREGEPGNELFMLLEGRVRVIKSRGTPEETELATLEAVTYLGEMAILADDRRTATIVADSALRIVALDGASLKELILQMPEISFEIFRVLTQRVRIAEARLSTR